MQCVRVKHLRAVLGPARVRVLLERVHRDRVVDRLDQAAVLGRYHDAEVVHPGGAVLLLPDAPKLADQLDSELFLSQVGARLDDAR